MRVTKQKSIFIGSDGNGPMRIVIDEHFHRHAESSGAPPGKRHSFRRLRSRTPLPKSYKVPKPSIGGLIFQHLSALPLLVRHDGMHVDGDFQALRRKAEIADGLCGTTCKADLNNDIGACDVV